MNLEDMKQRIKQIIEKTKNIKVEENDLEEIFDKYIVKYDETFNEEWTYDWYTTEGELKAYDFLLAVYFIGEWSFKYEGEIYGMYSENENGIEIYSTGKKLDIKSEDYFDYLNKININNKNILEIIDDVFIYRDA